MCAYLSSLTLKLGSNRDRVAHMNWFAVRLSEETIKDHEYEKQFKHSIDVTRMYYKLIRESADGKAVQGKLYWTSHYFNNRTKQYTERLHYICDTLENADHLVPALIYKIKVSKSPTFRRLLPLLEQVLGRSGIRIHRGTKPEHSKGCILVTSTDEQELTARFLAEQQAHEEIRLEICHPEGI